MLHMLYIVIEIIESKFLQIKILGTVIFISAPLFIVKGILLRVSLHYPTLNCHGFIYQLMRLEKKKNQDYFAMGSGLPLRIYKFRNAFEEIYIYYGFCAYH